MSDRDLVVDAQIGQEMDDLAGRLGFEPELRKRNGLWTGCLHWSARRFAEVSAPSRVQVQAMLTAWMEANE